MVTPNFPEEEIEERIPISASNEFDRTIDISTQTLEAEANVLMTPSMYVVELRISPKGDSTWTNQFHWTSGEAHDLVEQLETRSAKKFVDKFGDSLTENIASELEFAANVASTNALRELAGDGVIDSYKEGKITAEEVAHELGHQFDNEDQ